MSYPAGPDTYGSWPVAGDPLPRRLDGLRADPVAFVLLLFAGGCGVVQYVLAGYPVGQSDPAGGSVLSGRDLLAFLNGSTGEAAAAADVTRIALLVAGVGGAALVLLGLATLMPLTHRPFAAVGLIVSLAAVASAVWMVAQSAVVLGSPADALFSAQHFGWYLMAATGVLGFFGSVKALGDV